MAHVVGASFIPHSARKDAVPAQSVKCNKKYMWETLGRVLFERAVADSMRSYPRSRRRKVAQTQQQAACRDTFQRAFPSTACRTRERERGGPGLWFHYGFMVSSSKEREGGAPHLDTCSAAVTRVPRCQTGGLHASIAAPLGTWRTSSKRSLPPEAEQSYCPSR